MSDDARARRWIKWQRLPEGDWLIRCRLCGKRFTRPFGTERFEDPRTAASDYVGEHLRSPEHAAAVAAYRLPPGDGLTQEERLLRAIFGEPIDDPGLTDEKKRLFQARQAAESQWRNKR